MTFTQNLPDKMNFDSIVNMLLVSQLIFVLQLPIFR